MGIEARSLPATPSKWINDTFDDDGTAFVCAKAYPTKPAAPKDARKDGAKNLNMGKCLVEEDSG